MQATSPLSTASPFLREGGEMGNLTRAYDWSKTSLGTIETWPVSLRGYVNMVLSSRFPMLIFWGPELLCFYNDAFRPSLGDNGKHPNILGMKGKEAWAEVWDFTGPLIERILNGGEAAWYEDQSVPIYRNGKMEDVYWTFSYSPLTDNKGTIAGVLVTCTETTKIIKTLGQLQESEKRFRTLAERVPQFIWMTGPTGIEVTYVNKPYLDFLGLDDLNDFLGGAWQSLIHHDDLQIVHKTYSEAVAGKKPYILEARYKNANSGVYHWFLIQGQPRYEPDSTYAGFVGTLTDITTPKEANDKLRESEARLELLSNAVPAMIFLLDAEERYLSYNQTFMQWFGVDELEAVGKTVREFIGEKAYQIVEPHLANAYAGNTERYELESPSRMHGPRWLSIDYTPHKTDEGNVLGIIAHVTDITQAKLTELGLRESEARFRSLIEEAPVATSLFVGRELRIEVINEAMIAYMGKGRSVIGKPLEEALPELKGQPLLQILDDIYTTGETFQTNSSPVQLQVNGELKTYYFDYTFKPLKNAAGEVYGIMDMSVDVTDQVLARHQIEEVVTQRTKELGEVNLALQEANKELQRSNYHLEEFAHAASHDLKEPVRKIHFFTNQLKSQLSTQLKETEIHSFNRIENATQRMGMLIDDLLLYSHVSQRPHQKEPVKLNETIKRVLEDLELDIHEKSATIRVATLPEVKGYARQLQQLFQNLISNAVKYSKADVPPFIEIKGTEVKQKGRDYYLIEVADNGIGFDQEYAEKIFQMFTRLHGKNEYGGTGVGLSIVKKVVENHDGMINVESRKDVGSTFRIYLPLM